jgi:ketosteroid isomerase-like protein
VVGTAVWVSEESDGDPRAWQQSVTVVRNDAGGEWKVSSGQVIPPYVDTEYQSELPPGVG